MDINQKLTEELDVNRWQIDAAVTLIDEGNTIPFISRYRKEATGSLNDEQLRKLHERLLYLRNLEEKKEQVISSIEEQGKMTEELKEKILLAETLVTVEDLYRPYRPKRRTRATIAKEKGLEPLAAYMMLQQAKEPLEETAKQYISEEKEVKTEEEAIAGAKDIIAEIISDNADYRTWIRKTTMKKGKVVSTAKDPETESVYEMYYEFEESVEKLAGHRILALNRGENITIIFINNAIYGMTGGQMAPTTLVGMKTSTSPYGRDVHLHGYPLKMADIAAQLEGTAYVTRQSVDTVPAIRKAKKAIRKAFENSMNGKGSNLVEIVSTCNSGWKMTPQASNDWMVEHMFPFYPLGDLKDKE
mgnify:CR=1 FL=1